MQFIGYGDPEGQPLERVTSSRVDFGSKSDTERFRDSESTSKPFTIEQ